MSTSLTMVRVSALSSIRKTCTPPRSGHDADGRGARCSSLAGMRFFRSCGFSTGAPLGYKRGTNRGLRISTYTYVVDALPPVPLAVRLPRLGNLLPAGSRQQRAAGRRRRLLALDDGGRVALEVMGDRLHPDLHRAGRLGGVEVLEREEEGARALDDLLHRGVGRLVHAAFVGGQPDHARDPR